jgi:hypothetical protein
MPEHKNVTRQDLNHVDKPMEVNMENLIQRSNASSVYDVAWRIGAYHHTILAPTKGLNSPPCLNTTTLLDEISITWISP